jgi:hypothetical protein
MSVGPFGCGDPKTQTYPSEQAQNEKAARYIDSLNAARCSGSWNELPELIRKVTKHAPQRKCTDSTTRIGSHRPDANELVQA